VWLKDLGVLQWAQHDFDRKLASVLPPADKFDPHTDLLLQCIGHASNSVSDEPLRKAFRNDVFYLLPTSSSL
jgi:hypothetical protein